MRLTTRGVAVLAILSVILLVLLFAAAYAKGQANRCAWLLQHGSASEYTDNCTTTPTGLTAPRWVPPRASRSRALLPRTAAHPGQQRALTVTSYCDQGVTADGSHTQPGTAAGNSFRFGQRLLVPGWGQVTIHDRSAPGATDLDLWSASCARAWQWGRQRVLVDILP